MRLLPDFGGNSPDPYAITSGGKYYVYTTGERGVKIFRSSELSRGYECVGEVGIDGYKEYWAPAVIELDGKFYMYVSFVRNEATDMHEQAIHVFVADSPTGPFTLVKRLTDPFSIDAHVVKNESGLFLFYSLNDWDAARPGTYVAVDKMPDPFTVAGNPVPVVKPTLDEEIFERDRFEKGKDWHTIEGAFYFRVGDRHFLTYSGSCFDNENYFVGYAYARTTETDLTKIAFEKYPSPDVWHPILKSIDWEEGTGHNSVLKVGDKHYIFYHAREIGALDHVHDRRTARIAELKVDGAELTVLRRENGL